MFSWLGQSRSTASAPQQLEQLPMPFIVGAPRSGTTLLRFMLDSHSQLAIPPETGFIVPCSQLNSSGTLLERDLIQTICHYPPDAPAWGDFEVPEEAFRAKLCQIQPLSPAAGVRVFYELYAARFGKLRWGDKTPLYGLHLDAIAKLLAEARFVHVIRDGRDTALSLRHLWFSPGKDIQTLAAYWRRVVGTARAQGAGRKHYLEVRYEDLVLQTERVLREICSFSELDYEPSMLCYFARTPERLREHRERLRKDGHLVVSQEQRWQQQHRTTQPPDPSRIGGWKCSMTRDEQLQFVEIAGDLLQELGYEL